MENDTVLIFGKDTWPYTSAARADYARRQIPFEYVNVKASSDNMKRMLAWSEGSREVPVIVENGKVSFGFGGTW